MLQHEGRDSRLIARLITLNQWQREGKCRVLTYLNERTPTGVIIGDLTYEESPVIFPSEALFAKVALLVNSGVKHAPSPVEYPRTKWVPHTDATGQTWNVRVGA